MIAVGLEKVLIWSCIYVATGKIVAHNYFLRIVKIEVGFAKASQYCYCSYTVAGITELK